jgi:Ca2+-binding RTX toxin-like protein
VRIVWSITALLIGVLLLPSAAAHAGGRTDTCGGRLVTIHGSANDDVITGTPGDDVIATEEGDDTVTGLDGDDVACLGPGDDTFDGGHGSDVMVADATVDGADTFIGGGVPFGDDHGDYDIDVWTNRHGYDVADYSRRSTDVVLGLDGVGLDGEAGEGDRLGADVEEAVGGSGDDTLVGNARQNGLYGGDGDDRLFGADEADWFYGGPGDDTIHGGPGPDSMMSEPVADGADEFFGEAGEDRASYRVRTQPVLVDLLQGGGDGEPGEADHIHADVENVYGGSGGDFLYGTDQDNNLYGMGGDDWIVGRGGKDDLFGGDQDDSLYGDGGPDRLYGDRGDDFLSGGEGADKAESDHGADAYSGGSGLDSISYSGRQGRVEVSLDGLANDGEAGEGDNIGVFGDVEDVTGGSGDDKLIGNAAENELSGDYGDDEIIGGPGADRLNGDDGADRILALDNVANNDTVDGGRQVDLCTSDAADSEVNCEL